MIRFITAFTALLLCCHSTSFSARVVRPAEDKILTVTTTDKKLSLTIDYSKGCVITQLVLNGKQLLSPAGIYTGISTADGVFTSALPNGTIQVKEDKGNVVLSGISYGNAAIQVNEVWDFRVTDNRVTFSVTRDYSSNAQLEDMAFPRWNFADLSVWKGGIFDNGGMVWCKYLQRVNDTYGVHTGGVTFWNAVSGDGLRITATPDKGQYIAAKYGHSAQDEFTCTQLVTEAPLQQRYNLSRFVGQKADVFAAFGVTKGTVKVRYDLQYIDYFSTYSRGILPGIDADAVRELLNTTGRYGVVDNNITGANGWLTNWKCLHEPFFAQIGLALGDPGYTNNLSATLDQERKQAMLPNGRVLSRWHNAPGDEIPGTYNAATGYYEAMWGYTIDSQTGYVINTSEQFDLTGDKEWLRSHQVSCEKALDWLLSRDANDNGLCEMMNNGIGDKKASDWLDIVWASYENAFVNAQLYQALVLWAECERLLGSTRKADYYLKAALRLKTVFNQPVEKGGFWSAAKKQYVYWRDKDGSVHGDNLVTPVNFAAIAFGICDDKERIAMVLDQVEQRTVAEQLFHWPLCFDSFKQEEVHAGNWPFPKYENGDIFPTWGYLGVRAYMQYDKTIALKYITNLLAQYNKDGLSSQRYSRTTQLGQGDDILSGICTSITALYRDIYGIRPKWNRMGIEPNMLPALNDAQFSYTLRDTVYRMQLAANDYYMQTNTFSIQSNESFGVSTKGRELKFYPHNRDSIILQINGPAFMELTVNNWKNEDFSWTVSTPGKYKFTVIGLPANEAYRFSIFKTTRDVRSMRDGKFIFEMDATGKATLGLKKM